jgi:site-specific DNA-methyltransferase (adenine-specific)
MTTQLILGDCLQVLSTLPGKSIDLVITDPPYGINYRSNKQVRFDVIQGDEKLSTKFVREVYRVLKYGTAFYCFIGWRTWPQLAEKVTDAGFEVKNMIVMNKSNHGMGDLRGQYAYKYELCLYATKGRHILNFEDGRLNDVMDVPWMCSNKSRLHPNQKHVSWIEPFVKCSSKTGDTVLDPYCGSGTVLEVCRNMQRNSIGIEIDKVYYNVAKERLGL